LLEEPRFASVEKIKTVGATYMAAAGLNPIMKGPPPTRKHKELGGKNGKSKRKYLNLLNE